MLEVLTLIPTTADAADAEALLAGFVPSISAAPGLRSLRVSTGDIMSRGGPPPYAHVVQVTFDSLADWMTWVLAPAQQQREPGHPLDRVQPTIIYFESTDPRGSD